MRTQGTARSAGPATAHLFQKRFESLVDCSIQGIAVHRGRRIVFANAALARMFGYRGAERLLGTPPSDLVAPEDRKRVAAYGVERRSGRPAPERYEFRGLHRSGRALWLEARASVVEWDGAPAHLSTLVDITERKQAEQSLQASEERFRNLVEGSLEGILVLRNGRVLFLNRTLARMFRFRDTDDALRRGDWARQLAPGERARLRRSARARRQGGDAPSRYEFQGRCKDGTPIWLDASVRVIEWHGQPAIQATLIDITGRKEAEQAARVERRLLEAVLNAIPTPISFKDVGSRYGFVNRAFAAAWKRPAGAFVGRRGNDLPGLPKALAAQSAQHDRETLRKGSAVELPEVAIRTARGDVVRRILKIPVKDGRRRVVGLISISEDITQRKRAEADRVAAKNLLEQILANIPVGLSVVDKDLRLWAINENFLRLLGFPRKLAGPNARFEDFLRHNARRGEYGPGDVETLVAERVALARKFRPHRFERVRPGGPALEISGNPLPGGGFITTYVDITERRQAEEQLRANQRLLQTVLDSLPHSLTVKDAKGRYRLVNRAFASFWSQPPEAFLGRRPRELEFIPADYAREIDKSDRPTLEHGRASDSIIRQVSPFGQRIVQRVFKVPVRGEDGRVDGVVALIEDITERVKADEELRANRRLLQMVFDVIPINLFVKDTASRFVMANRAQCAFYGLTAEQFSGLPTAQLPGMTPALLKTTLDYDRQVLVAGIVAPVAEYERANAAGTVRWLRGLKLPLLDDAGQVAGLVGMAEDVTAPKRAQEALEASQRLLRTVVDSIPVNLFVKDTQGRFVLINRNYADFYGLEPEAVIGRTVKALSSHTPAHLADSDEWDRRVLTSGQRDEVPVLERFDRQGNLRLLHGVKLPLRDAHGAISGLIGMTQDITAQRQAARALQESEQRLRVLLDNAPIIIYSLDRQGTFILSEGKELATVGRKPGEVVGLSAFEVYKHLPGRIRQLRRGLAGEAFSEETLVDGQWFDTRHEPIRDAEGHVTGLVVVSTNVTLRHLAEEEAQASRRLLQTLFDTIPYEVLVKDLEGTYLMVNHAMARFYGTTPQRMVGMRTVDLPGLSSAQIEVLAASDRQVIESGESLDTPAVLLRDAQGKPQWVHTIKFPLRDGQGRVAGVVGWGEHVTDRKRSEEELRASRLLLQTVFDTIPMHLFVKDVRGHYVIVNKAGARFEGLSQPAFHGLPTEQLPNRSRAQIREILEIDRRVFQNGAAVDLGEYTRADGQGRQRWLRGRKLALRDEQGHVTGLLGVVEDITEHKVALEQLHASRRLLQTVFDALPLRVVVRDAQGRYLIVNRRMAEDHQRPPEAFVGQHFWNDEELPLAEREGFLARILQAEATGRPVLTPEMAVTLPGADRRLLRSIFVPLYDEHGTFQGTLGIGEDITERKKSEQALLQAQKLESLGVLAGGIAHDFNNLLVTIMGNASLAMLKLPPAAPPMEELQQIEMAGQRAADLCRQMLSYAGKGRIEKQPVSINQLVQEMTQLLRVSLPKGVSIVFRMLANPPLTEVDPTQIRQVIMNLVINAGEAIGENPGTIVIATGVTHVDRDDLAEAQSGPDTPEGDYVYLEVSDTGAGMDAETRARIFDPFFTTKFTGRGLGLASVLGIVRGHRGGLKVYSEVGKGTSFKVLLPAAVDAAVPLEPPQETGGWSGGGTILVIDDEQAIRSVAARMLTRLGFQVIEAADGATAVEIVRDPPAPLTAALLDLTMPGLSGEETLRRLRRLDKKLPVILMSGYNEREVLERFVVRELAGFLQKPFKLDDLRGKLRELFPASATSGATPSA